MSQHTHTHTHTHVRGSKVDGYGETMRKPTIRIANSIWVDNNTVPEYSTLVKEYEQQTNFTDEGVVSSWVSDATSGLIPGLLAPGAIDARLLAVRSVGF